MQLDGAREGPARSRSLSSSQPEVEKLVEADPGQKVQKGEKEGEESQHAREADEFGNVEDLACRNGAQGENEGDRNEVARGVSYEFDGVRPPSISRLLVS
jgi:hypothetical protein